MSEQIKGFSTVTYHMKRGAILERGNSHGWHLRFSPNKRRRVVATTAKDVIETMSQNGYIARSDDRTSRVGETWTWVNET